MEDHLVSYKKVIIYKNDCEFVRTRQSPKLMKLTPNFCHLTIFFIHNCVKLKMGLLLKLRYIEVINIPFKK